MKLFRTIISALMLASLLLAGSVGQASAAGIIYTEHRHKLRFFAEKTVFWHRMFFMELSQRDSRESPAIFGN